MGSNSLSHLKGAPVTNRRFSALPKSAQTAAGLSGEEQREEQDEETGDSERRVKGAGLGSGGVSCVQLDISMH